jgi:hypothetical protein
MKRLFTIFFLLQLLCAKGQLLDSGNALSFNGQNFVTTTNNAAIPSTGAVSVEARINYSLVANAKTIPILLENL